VIQEAHNRDILSSGARCLVNPVSACGGTKEGLCSLFVQKYPTMISGFRGMCAQRALVPGNLWMFQDPASGVWIANVAVRHKEGETSSLDWVDRGLFELARKVRQFEIISVAIPALGCEDNGGNEWHEVQGLVSKHFERTNATIIIYPPAPPKSSSRWSRR
jgi:hypothetical protein